MYYNGFIGGGLILSLAFVLLFIVMFNWWRDVIRESSYQGWHTFIVQRGLRIGMILFIVSEVLFFFSFFWAFFHSALAPDISLGSVWPPVGIEVLNAFEVPLLNTAILLSSGATITWSHNAIIIGERFNTILGLILTILLGFVFTILQGLEYFEASFTIADSAYGSTFFVATGFHGLHVIIGTSFLAVCLWRIINHHLTRNHHNGFEAAIWYWHFVDVVWVFLFTTIYWWGSLGA
jgi:cytochrome c oxidase subunit 3